MFGALDVEFFKIFERRYVVIDRTISTISEAKLNSLDFAETFENDANALIQRAKEILMRQRGLDDHAAYLLLADIAEKRRMSVISIAQQLIETANRLTI